MVAPSSLRAIVASYTAANNQANETLSVSSQDRDEEGSAAAIDDASFRFDLDAGYKTVAGAKGTTYHPFGFNLVRAVVPSQSSYPAVGLAVVSQPPIPGLPSDEEPSAASRTLLLVKRDSTLSPWRVALEPATDASALPSFVVNKAGYASLVTSSDGLRTSLSSLSGLIATDLTKYATSGTLEPGLTKSDFESNTPWALPDLYAILQADSSSEGTTTMATRSWAPADLVAFRLSDGGALALVTLEPTITMTARTGYAISYKTTSSDPPSFAIASGNYSSLSEPIGIEIAVVIPPATASGAPFQIIGSSTGALPGHGTLVSGSGSGSSSPTLTLPLR